MMKKTLCYLLVLILLLTLSACGGRRGDTSSAPAEEAPTVTVTVTTTVTTSITTTTTAKPTTTTTVKPTTTTKKSTITTTNKKHRLIVKGNDITEGNYLRFFDDGCQAEVPLLAILRELGVETEWKGNLVQLSYKGEVYETLDTTDLFFEMEEGDLVGSMPYTVVRKIVGDELVVDAVSAGNFIDNAGKPDNWPHLADWVYVDKNECVIVK